ncbi:hypothetical protein CCR84_14155 [Rhodocyclus purpureus]|nr:hypothetical protein [Rhodocyclus purpureus]
MVMHSRLRSVQPMRHLFNFILLLAGFVRSLARWHRPAWATVLAAALLLPCLVMAQAPASGDPTGGLASGKGQAEHRYLLAQAYWTDVGGKTSFAQAREQSYTPYEGLLNRGYTDAVHWLRLTVAASETPLGLFISPPWLDEITLYDPATDTPPITAGDRYPASQSAFHSLGHSFKLPPSPAARDVWLRLQSTSTHIVNLEVMAVDDIPRSITGNILWAAVYATLLLLIFLVLLVIWWLQRDRILSAYLVRHAVFTYYVFAFLGLPALLLSAWLPPAFFDKFFSLSATVLMTLGLRFDIELLSSYKPNRHLLRLIEAIPWIGVGLVIMLLAGYERQALQMNVYILMVTTLLLMLTALSCKPDPGVERLMSKQALLAYYTIIMGGLLVSLIALVGWIQPRPWTLQILIFNGMVSALVMTGLLFIRSQRRARDAQRKNWELTKAQEDLELEHRRRQEQSQFLHMLMHELKTPLSIVSLALGTKGNREQNLNHAGRAVQDMKAILERCIQADRSGELMLNRRVEQIDLDGIIRNLGETIPGLQKRLQFAPQAATHLQTDRQLLRIVLGNLLHNAAAYGDPVAPVTVSLRSARYEHRDGTRICIGNIPGLAGWPDQQQLFSKYYRSPGAQRESGSGLGLYLARQLASSLGGWLRYCPTDTEVRFELWLPQTPA